MHGRTAGVLAFRVLKHDAGVSHGFKQPVYACGAHLQTSSEFAHAERVRRTGKLLEQPDTFDNAIVGLIGEYCLRLNMRIEIFSQLDS